MDVENVLAEVVARSETMRREVGSERVAKGGNAVIMLAPFSLLLGVEVCWWTPTRFGWRTAPHWHELKPYAVQASSHVEEPDSSA